MQRPSADVSSIPRDFLWGAATSAYQIEGAVDQGGRGPSIWDTFSHTPGKVRHGDTGDVACDHYHRFAEDVALMADLGLGAYRFSLAWPRIVPDGVGAVSEEGVAFYRRLAEALRETGIEPLVTLYHWDLPQALQDRGGWQAPDSVDWFAAYAAVAKEALGDLVTMWTTLNEPYCVAFLGHGSGLHAPGIADPSVAHLAAHHLVLAHHAGAAALRSTRPRADDRIGAVLNVIPAWPAGDSDEDRRVAGMVDAIHNGMFLEGTLRGRYPEAIVDLQERFGIAAAVDLDELAATRAEVDFLGVNYYNVNRFRHRPGAPAPGEFPGADGAVLVPPTGEVTEMDWGVGPEGLSWVLDRLAGDYPDLPLYVTENGAAFPDRTIVDGVVDDPDRIAYLRRHVSAIADAAARGVDVRGYFVWSLLDNFEWSHGYSKRFGLVHVDFDTLERTPKRSAGWYRGLIGRWASTHGGTAGARPSGAAD
jgi:beta-glucosidase